MYPDTFQKNVNGLTKAELALLSQRRRDSTPA